MWWVKKKAPLGSDNTTQKEAREQILEKVLSFDKVKQQRTTIALIPYSL